MAEGNPNTRDRASPKEDFNPLAEDLIADPADADMSSDEDEPSDRLPSMDGELEDYFNRQAAEIPFSPPKSSRQAKRDKVKYGKKSSKDGKYMTSDKLKKSVVNVIKERYGDSNNLYTGLTGVDSDADVEKEVSREHKDKKKKDRDEKQKTMTKNRQHDIYDKRMSVDSTAVGTNISTDTAPMEIQTPVVPVKLTGSGRFHSFKILPVSTASLEPIERRQPCASKTECPKDRLAFYKTFAALINMGSHGKKQKEQRDKDRFFSQRQKSSDEKLWFNYIWIGLQAWLNGVPPQQQEADVQREREKVPKVLHDVKNFKVQFSQSFLGFNIGGQAVCASGVPSNRHSTESVETEVSIADIQETYHTMCLSTEMINQQQEALEQVRQILNRLDQCEQLFPTSGAFAQEFPMYKEPDFVKRFEALYLWLNITEDLCHKLKLLGKVINVESIPGANWPTIDFDCPRSTVRERTSVSGLQCASIPEIMQNSGSEEEEEMDEAGDGLVEEGEWDMGNAEKKVSFAVSEEQGLESFTTSLRRTPSPSNMTNPQDSSTPVKFNTSISHASSEASLEDLSRSSLYRSYVDKGLKKVGLNKILVRLRDILDCSLQRARNSLERPKGEFLHSDSICKSPTEDLYSHVPSSPSLDLLDKQSSSTLHICSRCLDHVTWREEFLDIGLPSFRPTYMFLVRVLLDVIHEAMKIRLGQLKNPICDPSFHSKRQLIRDCKDVLAKAVLVKQYYQHMIAAVLDDDELDSENSPMDLETFDDDMSNMFKMYFQYLQNWLYDLQNLPEASRSLKIPLEEEWSFTKKICPHIIGGEAEAGKRFSTMAISLLNSIADFLDSSTDEYTTILFDWTNQEFDVSSSESDQSDDDDHDFSQQSRCKNLKQTFQKTCRNFKNLFHEARERASKALGFAKLLRKDLEIAADFDTIVPTGKLLKKLKETGHVRIQTPLPAGYLMFIPERIVDQRRQILQLLNVTCGREGIAAATDPSPKDEGYLLMVRCVGDLESPVWEGTCIQVEPTAETAIALSHLQVTSLLLVVIHSSHLSSQRRDFETLMNSTVELVNEQTSCHQVITESLFDLKESAICLRDKVAAVIRRVDENWNCDTELEGNVKIHVLKLYRETMLQAYNFGFEVMKEVTRLVSGETRHKLGHGLVNFAMDFMKFVSEKCERGRGMRPRWANQGLDFLLVACDPKILSVLSEQEYQDLQQRINEFISHLIGSADKTSAWSPTHGGGLPMARSATEGSIRQPYNRYSSWPASTGDKMPRSPSTRSVQSESQTSPQSAPARTNPDSRSKKHSDGNIEVDLHDGDDGGIVMDVHKCRAASGDNLVPAGFSYKPQFRIVKEIDKLEQHRSDKLQASRVIGRVTSRKSGVSYHVNARKVKFHWHKGKKIGEGQFGKVYSAVNMDTGELMAMKEMKFSTTDMQMHIKEIIDEITIFEGINHPNLVKYYGVEVHRAEMFVFMEYCDQGTLDQVSLVGLPEELIRIYTRELLIAVHKLHENGIVHRDIKGQNIFLTSKGCLKLGDFGCSVKLKNHTTMAGEVNSLVGTTAYMAPEVITRNDREGHGRAADIWSVGCVVIEMASGKRPWHELESNYQIMFKVGMGDSPPIPDTLGSEGKDFLAHCLEHDPANRWTAIQLRDHPFPKIYDEDEERTSQPYATSA